MDATKNDIGHHETIRDEDLIGEKGISQDRIDHLRHLSPEELVAEKKLRRKIDGLIMPVVVTVYLMNYIDRNNYAAARLQGLEADLGLVGDQYQTALSILFVGYVRQSLHYQIRVQIADSLPGAHASSFQRRHEPRRTTIYLSRLLHMRLGTRLLAHEPGQKLWRNGGVSIYSGNRRGTVFRRCALLPVKMVHQEGAQPADVHLLLCINA